MRIAEPATGRSLFGTANSTFNHGFINDFDVIVVVLWMRPPVAEFLTALEHLQSKTPTDLLIYLRTSAFNAEDMSVIEQQQLADDVQRLDDFCVMLRSHPHVSPRVWKEFTDADSFTDQLEFDLERYIEGHLFGDAQPAVCWDANPFVGLESFGPGQAMIFCGRDAAVQEALTELQRRASASVSLPSLLIVGASGTGKSSLARCGLAGRIGLLFPTAPQIELRPGDGNGSALIQRLGAELMRLFPDHGLRLNELMLRDPAAAVMQLERLRPNLTSSHHEPVFVLIVDQLEELFTPQPDADDLRQFATMLDLLVRRGLCWCIATLRSDCLGHLSDVKSFSHFTENGGVYVLPQPTPSEIRSMIRRPARLAGVHYEQQTDSGATLSDRILRDVPRGSSGLPLLQFTLRKLYDERSASGSLTYRAYTSLGGLLGCVAAHAESVFSELAVHEQQVFAVVFRELVRVSTDDRLPARQRCRLLVFDGNTAAMGLVQALISARLLVRDDEHGVSAVELVHESLLQTWPRLRDWLSVEGELLRKRLRLLEACERWSQSHRTPDLLLPRGTALDEANEVLSAGLLSAEHDGPSLVRRFIRQSQRAVQRIQRQRRRAADLLADSQLKSLELSIDSVSDSLVSLEQLAAKELDADRLPNTLQYLHEAELLATTRRGELLRQIEERLTVPERNNRADSGFAARLQALRQRVSDSLFLDPEYWRHREANILREFPELVWRRNLKTKIKRAILSPNNDYLLLLTAFRTDETVVVWDLKKNQPTECCVKLQFTQGTPVLTWAADGRSFILINQNASSDPVIADTQICVWDAISGDLITGPIRHRGLVLDAACSADDGHLVVVNRYDGTAIELQTLLERSATIVEPSGFIAVCKSLFRTNAPTATVTRYEMPSLKIIRQKVIGGWIRSCSMVDGWLACQPIQTVREPDAEAAEGTVVLINFHLEAELRYADALTAGSIGLSPDGRYLAVAGRETGIQLLERVHGRLRWLANAGTSPPDAVIQVRPRVAEPGVTPDIDIVVGETPFTTDGKVASTRQTIVSYTYSAQSRKISTTFSVAAEAQLTALALHRNGTGFGLLAAGLANGSAHIWQRSTGKSLTPFLDLAHECVLVEFLDRSDFSFGTPFPFLTVTNGGEITLWNISANALREPLLLSDVSRQRPVSAPSNLPKLSVWQSPDEQKLVYHMPDRWTDSVMVVPRGQVQHRPENIVIIGFAAEDVFWTPDSRYAVIVSGLTSRRTGPVNVLYSNAIVSSQMKFEIPQQSYLAVVDLHSLKLVGRPLRFDGPLVDVQMHSVQNVCFVGFLSATSGKGQLWRLNPADLTFDSFTEQMPEFCCFSVTADFTTAVISDRSGQPMVFCNGQPVRKLPKPVHEITGYIGLQILDSGFAVLMEPADPSADVVHVSLVSGDFCGNQDARRHPDRGGNW
jgi:WD40 repeat protein